MLCSGYELLYTNIGPSAMLSHSDGFLGCSVLRHLSEVQNSARGMSQSKHVKVSDDHKLALADPRGGLY
jgi:hypothetical protein